MTPHKTLPATRADERRRQAERHRFDRIYTQFAPRIRGYLRRLSGSTTEAEDVTQEVFLAAYAGRAAYRGGAPPLSWLMGIARRRLRDRGRGHTVPTTDTALPEDAQTVPGPEANVLRASQLQSCLDCLDADSRDALMLVFGQGLTYAEAANALNQPIGTVKWRVHAASRRMRELLHAADEEPL